MQANTAYDLARVKNNGTDEVVYEELEIQQDKIQPKTPKTAAMCDNDCKKKKAMQLKRFEIVSVLALILAALALVLVLVQYISSSSNHNQQSVSQEEVQMLKTQLNNLMGIQTRVNKSTAEIWTKYEQFEQNTNDTLMRLHDCCVELSNISSSNHNQQSVSQEEVQTLKTRVHNLMGIQTQVNKSTTEIWTKYEQFEQSTNTTLMRLHDCCANIGSIVAAYHSCSPGGTVTQSEPASSCRDLCQGSPSGEYWIQANGNSRQVLAYCDTSSRNCSCNHTEGGWMRVANLDMTDPTQQCPDGFRLVNRTSPPLRTCGRPDGHRVGCVSTTFPVHEVQYTRVCGRIVGYQYGLPIAFHMYLRGQTSIDGHYLEGISLTHGQSPRQHIWSFVGSAGEEYTLHTSFLCPCTRAALTGIEVPPFVGNDYFCDTAIRGGVSGSEWHPNDPLWDGQGCGGTSTCCEFNNPPWFCKQLPQPTADDIELRICNNNFVTNDDTPFETVEIYIN